MITDFYRGVSLIAIIAVVLTGCGTTKPSYPSFQDVSGSYALIGSSEVAARLVLVALDSQAQILLARSRFKGINNRYQSIGAFCSLGLDDFPAGGLFLYTKPYPNSSDVLVQQNQASLTFTTFKGPLRTDSTIGGSSFYDSNGTLHLHLGSVERAYGFGFKERYNFHKMN